MSEWPWPERFSCDGDEYHDVFVGDFVVGARSCLGCPSCKPEWADWPPGGLPHGEHPYDYGYGE